MTIDYVWSYRLFSFITLLVMNEWNVDLVAVVVDSVERCARTLLTIGAAAG